MKSQSNIRIIGGKWRSRKVSFKTKDDLRPTPDRVRETLFNWLAPYIVDSVCLDLYAGTGALGFEALSRGAKSVKAIEKDPEIVQQIMENAENLGAENFDLKNADCLKLLSNKGFAADIVFADPPYKQDLLAKTFAELDENNWLKKGSLVYFELDKPIAQDLLPATWSIYKESKAGQVLYYLAIKER